MNRKVKIALNITAIVLDAVGSVLREKRFKELEARTAALEEQLDNHKANHAPKTIMSNPNEFPLNRPPYGSGFNATPYGTSPVRPARRPGHAPGFG